MSKNSSQRGCWYGGRLFNESYMDNTCKINNVLDSKNAPRLRKELGYLKAELKRKLNLLKTFPADNKLISRVNLLKDKIKDIENKLV